MKLDLKRFKIEEILSATACHDVIMRMMMAINPAHPHELICVDYRGRAVSYPVSSVAQALINDFALGQLQS